MPARLAIRADGRWLGGYWGTPVISWRYPLGCWELTWNAWMPPATRPDYLRDRAPVEAFIGAQQIWAGRLPILDWQGQEDDGYTFTAQGAVRDAEEALALTSAGMTTSRPRTAAAQAIARGALDWRDVSALPDTVYSDNPGTATTGTDDTSGINYVGALLDAACEEDGKEWGIDGGRDTWLSTRPIPGTDSPAYVVTADTNVLGTTSESAARSLAGRYLNSATGKLATARAGTGAPEKAIDLTPLGAITTSRATSKLKNILTKIGVGIGWKNGVTITPTQITTLGGARPHLGHVAAECGKGVMVRITGQTDPRQPGVSFVDAVVGEAVWTPEENTLALNPIETEADDLATVVEQAGGQIAN